MLHSRIQINEPADRSKADTTPEAGATETGTDTDTDTGEPACEPDGLYEPNDAPEMAAIMPLASNDDSWIDAGETYATICPDDGAWHLFDASQHTFQGDTNSYLLSLMGSVQGSSICAGIPCEDPFVELPPALEDTLNIELHDADNMMLLWSSSSNIGGFLFQGLGAEYDTDLLIHIYAPPGVGYAYTLRTNLRVEKVDDECE